MEPRSHATLESFECSAQTSAGTVSLAHLNEPGLSENEASYLSSIHIQLALGCLDTRSNTGAECSSHKELLTNVLFKAILDNNMRCGCEATALNGFMEYDVWRFWVGP